jgi:hypothetical protein
MNTMQGQEIVDGILEKDKAFFAEMFDKHGAATFCANCKRNTAAGYYPMWHVKRRTLCSSCAPDYTQLLKALGLWDA